MTYAPTSADRTPARLASPVPDAARATRAAGRNRRAGSGLVPALRESRRRDNRRNRGLVAELRCECAIPSCRETLPAAANYHRGTADRYIVAPAHLNGGTPVRVADRFFVISNPARS